MNNGWFKLHRSVLDNPVVMKDADHLALWVWILGQCAFEPHDTLFGGKRITLQAGEFVTGRNAIVKALKINRGKVERILRIFENEQQIVQVTTPNGRLISVKNWNNYQIDVQVNVQEVCNDCATSVQQVCTTKESKEGKKERSIRVARPTIEDVRAYCEERQNGIDAQRFIDYYESNGWKVGRSTMKDWKAAVRNWERREKPKNAFQNQHDYDFSALERELVGRTRG